MTTYRQSTRTEIEGMRRLTGWLQSISRPTPRLPLGYAFTKALPRSDEKQHLWGDVVYFCKTENRIRTIELKIEEKFTGNAFLEIFSNIPATRDDFLEWGVNCGWLFKNPAEKTAFQWLDSDSLYVVDTFGLMRWALETQTSRRPDTRPRLFDFKFTQQAKCTQKNHTWGFPVPLAILRKELGFELEIDLLCSRFPPMEDAA